MLPPFVSLTTFACLSSEQYKHSSFVFCQYLPFGLLSRIPRGQERGTLSTCWGFMALGFVGGVMSLLWMGAATLFMVLEKLPQIGQRVTKPMGVLLILGGGVLAFAG